MFEKLKKQVAEANLKLIATGLVMQTWGNASGVDRERQVMVIKPSGVPYEDLLPAHMVVVSLVTGKVVGGTLTPSLDTATHLELYRAFPSVGGIVHSHSLHATAWAQACRNIPAYGTTQADYWHGEVPCTRPMSAGEIKGDYEKNTGTVIVETFKNLNPLEHPAVLVAGVGPFAWGRDVAAAVQNAEILEFVARLASETLRINPTAAPLPAALLDKHFLRKNGPQAYHGQK